MFDLRILLMPRNVYSKPVAGCILEWVIKTEQLLVSTAHLRFSSNGKIALWTALQGARQWALWSGAESAENPGWLSEVFRRKANNAKFQAFFDSSEISTEAEMANNGLVLHMKDLKFEETSELQRHRI